MHVLFYMTHINVTTVRNYLYGIGLCLEHQSQPNTSNPQLTGVYNSKYRLFQGCEVCYKVGFPFIFTTSCCKSHFSPPSIVPCKTKVHLAVLGSARAAYVRNHCAVPPRAATKRVTGRNCRSSDGEAEGKTMSLGCARQFGYLRLQSGLFRRVGGKH